MLVTGAGVLPDIDGLGIVAELATRDSARSRSSRRSEYRHVLGHDIGFALLTAVRGQACWPSVRFLSVVLAVMTFHLHMLGGLVGSSRTRDGFQWPIPCLLPFIEQSGS